MSKSVHIIDTTLREGEQSPGVLFSERDKRHIIDGLVNIGIQEAELGIASELQADSGPIIDYCRDNHPHLQTSLWSRCKKEDIAYAAARQPDVLSLSIPLSDIHLRHKLQKSRHWARSAMIDSIEYAVRCGLQVSVGFEDATRCDPDFLLSMAKTAEQHGASRIRIADTVGIGSPMTINNVVTLLKDNLSRCAVGLHSHNDFGMATANSICALEAGADTVDVVVLGLGERTGCARLEEVVGYLSLAKNHPQFKPQHLKPLAKRVASIAGRTISNTRPVIGEDIFTCETGLHLQGLQSNPLCYEPFNPEKVQAKRKLLYGSKSGKQALVHRCNQISPTPISDLSDGVISHIRNTSKLLRRPLQDEELRTLLSSTLN